MKITFHGAARTVTGSKHIIHLANNKNILLDCGMFQGMGTETFELNNDFGFAASDIDVVIISHAHIDHIGLLPKLIKEGYKGEIYCTEATAALAEILLKDSAHIQEMDVKYANKMKAKKGRPFVEPLYTTEEALRVLSLLKTVKYDEWFEIDDQISLFYTDAGHILGSACVNLKLKENGKTVHLTFSGDLGRYMDTLLKSPEPFPQADFIIMESTYGDRLHPLPVDANAMLFEEIQKTCVAQKGKLIIPAFSVGRTQELLYALNQFSLERRLPGIKYFVDSPMSLETTEATKRFPKLFNSKVQKVLEEDNDPFDFPGLTMIENVQASKSLNFLKEPCVIISASGMAEAGRVKHHIANNIDNPNNTILIVGYCEPQSLGGRLRAGAEEVSIFGQRFKVNARVSVIENLSAHGDYHDLTRWLSCQDPKLVKKLFLVHGEYEVQQKLANYLSHKGFLDIEIPYRHQQIGLGI